jgi:transcriptional regulator with AAA-type ATPase domain
MPDNIKYDGFPIKSSKMKEVFREVADYAKQGYPLVLFGPSGSGKEFLAHHYFENYMACFKEEGRFESFNCANLLDTTSVVELFGSVPGIYTNATDRSGLLEDLKLGVLFLDEVGDLSPNVQPMLLRALHTNPKLREGRRLGAKENYKIDSRLCIVCATEKPKENIQESLFFRMGAVINVPELDERPEDVESALPWFFERSINTIRQKKSFLSTLNQNLQNNEINNWSDFSDRVSRHLLPLVLSRKWSGNFRAFNSVITQSVIRSANSTTYNQLFDNVIRNFKKILPNYSKPGNNANIPVFNHDSQDKLIEQEEMENQLHEVVKIFPRIAQNEAIKIAEFLVNYSSVDFRRTDFESFTGIYKTARTAQKRLRELVNNNLLAEKEKGIYCIKKAQMRNNASKRFLSFTAPKGECPEYAARILSKDVLPLITESKGIYISTKTENRGKVAVCLAKLLAENYTVLYISFNESGIENLAEAIQCEVLNQNPYPDFEETLKKTTDINLLIPFLSGYLRVLFNESAAPVLILEHVDKLSRQERKELLPHLLNFWSCFRFVLTGDKMGNEFSNLTEYELDETL